MIWGYTFSTKYCQELELDWRETFDWINEKYQFKTVRLCAYWDLINPKPGVYDFKWLDELVDKSEQAGLDIIIAIGRKVPRWPEFHEPKWSQVNKKILNEGLLDYLAEVVNHYKSNRQISRWQIENEPFWDFGIQKYPISEKTVAREIELVKKLDKRPIIITDSANNNFIKANKYADQIGINIYTKIRKRSHYWPFPPIYYRIRKYFSKVPYPNLIAELQAEPWGPDKMANLTKREWQKTMSAKRLKSNVKLAHQLKSKEALMWGVEWWHYLDKKGDPEIADTAELFINKNN